MNIRALLAGLILVLSAGPALPAPAQPQPAVIAAAEIKAHVGQTVVVDASVSGVHRTRSGSGILLDMNGIYPSNIFTAVIFKSDAAKFSNLDQLSGKAVRITGAVKLYRGKPEIVLSNPSQLQVKPRAT